jgi:hypothetical protein
MGIYNRLQVPEVINAAGPVELVIDLALFR